MRSSPSPNWALAPLIAIERPSNARGMRLHLRPIEKGDRTKGGGDTKARLGSRPQPGGYPDICDDDCHSRADGFGSSGKARRLSPLCRPGKRADANVRLDGRRLLAL